MNRFNRTFNKAAVGLIAAVALAGCGTGQISQTADQASAVNGSEATAGDLALRDVHIQAVQNSDQLERGTTVDLVFVATNQSPERGDELTGITTPVGKVSVTGNKSVPPSGTLIVTAPAGPDLPTAPLSKALPEVTDSGNGAATVTLDEPIRNGMTYEFTFDFKNAGQIRVDVPISAGVPTRS